MYRYNLGKPLKIIPFRAAMYVIHNDNISRPKHDRIFKHAKWESVFNYNNLEKEFEI